MGHGSRRIIELCTHASRLPWNCLFREHTNLLQIHFTNVRYHWDRNFQQQSTMFEWIFFFGSLLGSLRTCNEHGHIIESMCTHPPRISISARWPPEITYSNYCITIHWIWVSETSKLNAKTSKEIEYIISHITYGWACASLQTHAHLHIIHFFWIIVAWLRP